jgi:SAM-dependent methyltransferase
MKTDTAHLAWNKNWASTEGRAGWLVPEPDVAKVAERLRIAGEHQRALDLGCGVGRHALGLARLGYDTAAVDMADAGLAEVSRNARAENLSVAVQAAPMTALPFGDATFDFVVAFNVIYHGDEAVVRAATNEIRRVLKIGGTYQGTMLSKRTLTSVRAQEISPNTFVREGDTEDDKHPHFYCNARQVLDLFNGFEPRVLEERAHRTRAGFWHWHLVAERC